MPNAKLCRSAHCLASGCCCSTNLAAASGDGAYNQMQNQCIHTATCLSGRKVKTCFDYFHFTFNVVIFVFIGTNLNVEIYAFKFSAQLICLTRFPYWQLGTRHNCTVHLLHLRLFVLNSEISKKFDFNNWPPDLSESQLILLNSSPQLELDNVDYRSPFD